MKQFLKDNLDRVLGVAAMLVLTAGLILGNKPATATTVSINAFVDPLTGCQYLAMSSGGALVPRLTKNGDHICNAPDTVREN